MTASEAARGLRLLGCLLLLAALAACAGRPGTVARGHHGGGYAAGKYYPPPGPPGDPWGPYIQEAAGRFAIPERWIREVMHQESGGQQQAVSWVGAMGLMQVMPDTYEGLRQRYALGDDPFDPHNNIMAGAAYIKEMYDRYGSPGFLAAYNAGPNRLDSYLAGASSLPNETVNYLASIAPRLGNEPAMTGPLAVYAMGGAPPAEPMLAVGQSVPYASMPLQTAPPPAPLPGAPPSGAFQTAAAATLPAGFTAPIYRSPTYPSPTYPSPTPAGCDPDAAYDPGEPCKPPPPAPPPQDVLVAAPPQPPAASPAVYAGTASALYQPTAQPPPAAPTWTPMRLASAPAVASSGGEWAIQVGAFASASLARSVADAARGAAPDLLAAARLALPATSPFGGNVLYRARLTDLSAGAATSACARLSQRQLACMVIPPGQI
jgi:hypothetical protein